MIQAFDLGHKGMTEPARKFGEILDLCTSASQATNGSEVFRMASRYEGPNESERKAASIKHLSIIRE